MKSRAHGSFSDWLAEVSAKPPPVVGGTNRRVIDPLKVNVITGEVSEGKRQKAQGEGDALL